MPTHGPRDTMRQQSDTYLARRRSRVRPSTLAMVRGTLYRFATWWDASHKVPKSLREQDVYSYVWSPHECTRECGRRTRGHRGAGLRDTYGDGALNVRLGHLEQFLTWGIRYQVFRPEVLEPVTERVKVEKVARLQLTVPQLYELIEGCTHPWERFVCALATWSAGRDSELRALRVGDVDRDGGEIFWARDKVRDRSDHMPITADLDKELQLWLDHYELQCGPPRPDWYLIPRRRRDGRWGGAIQYFPLEQRVRCLAAVTNIHLARTLSVSVDDVRGEGVHTMRRSMARNLFEILGTQGHPDPLGVVQAILGHASRVMTERYIGVDGGRRERDRLLRGRSIFGERHGQHPDM